MNKPFANDPEMVERIINGIRNALTGTTGEYVSKFWTDQDEVSVTFERHKTADDRVININLPTGATGQSLDAIYSQDALRQHELRKLQWTGPNA